MGTGYHAIAHAGMRSGDTVAVLGPRPGRALRGAGGAGRRRGRGLRDRLGRASGWRWRREFGATPLHLTEEEPKRAVRAATEGRGVDVVVDAVGDPAPLAMAISLARDAGTVSGIGAYAGKGEVPLGLAWLKGLTAAARPRQRDRPRRPRPGPDRGRQARPGAAGHPPHEARRGGRGLRALRPAAKR